MSRIALITGGAQGIGAAAAKQFLQNGFAGVVLLDRNADRLNQEAEILRELGSVEILQADLTHNETPARAVAFTVEKFGKLDVLVNAAGNTARGGIADISIDNYEALFDVNVKAPLFLMQEACKIMQAQKSGVIINVASMIALGGPPNLAVYGASKAALLQLTKHAAHTYAWDGIRCFCINLGWAFTEGEQTMQIKFHGLAENWSEEVGAAMPAGRMILPADIAELMSYLTSPSAQMMNGAVIDFEQVPSGVFRDHPVLKS
jgi:NAD(P)-dependent dehydrogenase (short-subunit alcohol dehydrogenase family)